MSSWANQIQNQADDSCTGDTAKQGLQQERYTAECRGVQTETDANGQGNTDDGQISLGELDAVQGLNAGGNNATDNNQHDCAQYRIRDQIDHRADFGEEADDYQHSTGNSNNIAAGNAGNGDNAQAVAVRGIGQRIKQGREGASAAVADHAAANLFFCSVPACGNKCGGGRDSDKL